MQFTLYYNHFRHFLQMKGELWDEEYVKLPDV